MLIRTYFEAMIEQENSARSNADEQIHTRVREIAHALYFANGFSATSSDAIAKAAGISKKTLYRLFFSKEELLRAVMHDTMRAIEIESDPMYDDHAMEFKQKASLMLEYISSKYSRFSSNAVIADFRRHAPDVWNEVELWLIKRREKFRSVIEDGIAQNHIRPDLTSRMMLTIYMTIVSRCIEHASLEEGSVTPGDVYSGFMKIFYEGIRWKGSQS
ncbi:TetR/AcrR family transcriptional regulator [soil metagenome]